MGTLVVLALLTFVASVGVSGWEAIVYDAAGNEVDKPLPLALGAVVGVHHPLYHLLISIGLLGLIASFHGIILVAGRATLEFGRFGYLPGYFGKTLEQRKTPAAALLLNMVIGFAALATGRTGEIITMSVFGALTLYIGATCSLFRLRASEPELDRPFRVPMYPFLPAVALTLAVLCLVAVAIYNLEVGLLYLTMILGGYVIFRIARRPSTQP
jgi:ethanolamine permease